MTAYQWPVAVNGRHSILEIDRFKSPSWNECQCIRTTGAQFTERRKGLQRIRRLQIQAGWVGNIDYHLSGLPQGATVNGRVQPGSRPGRLALYAVNHLSPGLHVPDVDYRRPFANCGDLADALIADGNTVTSQHCTIVRIMFAQLAGHTLKAMPGNRHPGMKAHRILGKHRPILTGRLNQDNINFRMASAHLFDMVMQAGMDKSTKHLIANTLDP